MILRADARHIPLADGVVQTVVSSPPYWSLRDYGVAGQIGLELTPEAYVATMVGVMREVWRCLKDDGTVWLNLGDSYAGSGRGGDKEGHEGKQTSNGGSLTIRDLKIRPGASRADGILDGRVIRNRDGIGLVAGLKPKDLCGMPWRVAFALQADGWYLRSDIVWAKPNPMPESVTDRPTRSHEYIFLLTKSPRYFYDADAIREPQSEGTFERFGKNPLRSIADGRKSTVSPNGMIRDDATMPMMILPNGRNKRDVWTVNSEPTPEAHFATFPQKLIEPCILAGSRVGDWVLDPFIGSGTVGKVSERFGRRWVGLELSPDYIKIALRRSAQLGLRL